MSLFLGSTLISAKSLPLPQSLGSSCIFSQLSPASLLLYMPLACAASTVAYKRLGSLGAMVNPIRPNPTEVPGNPFVNFFHVVPPSVDLNKPLSGPSHAPFYQDPCLPAHRSAYTILGLTGSIV